MSKKIFVPEKQAKEVRIDEFITIYNYFTKEDSEKVSLVTARLNGPHTTRINKRSDKLFLLIDGEAEMVVGKDKIQLKKGDAVRVPANTWHSIIGHKAYMSIIVSPSFDPADEEMS